MSQISENPFIIVDGSSYLYRAYNVFPHLTNSAGKPTGAIYGMLNMLHNLILRYQPTYAIIVFDAKGKTFRNRLFKNYKFNRSPMPDNLFVQIKPLQAIIKAMGLSLIEMSGIEADDIIGTLAYNADKMGFSVLISTCDKDMAQLVTPKITLINTMTNTILGPKEVVVKYGVPPERIIDFLALMGDASDNIPGVPGIGKKISQILLQRIGGLNTLYAQIDRISGLTFRGAKNVAVKLQQNKEIAYISYQLATIKTDLELDLNFEELAIQELMTDKLLNLFKKYEFKRWIASVESGKWFLQTAKKGNILLQDKKKRL